MTPEQQLVQQINTLIDSNQLENRDLLMDYADQFAESCRAINERLNRCADYLDKGMRSEADYEARMAPDLLQIHQLFTPAFMRKWHNLCVDLELTLFQPLNEELLGRLKTECAREADLEPLMKEYRRHVYQGNRRGSIEVLRKLRECDPDNPSWAMNLQPLEEAELRDWLLRGERALQANDQAEIKAVSDELSHPQRVVHAAPAFMKRLRLAQMSERTAAALADAERVQNTLVEAMEKKNAPAITAQLQAAAEIDGRMEFLEKPDDWSQCQVKAREVLAEIREKEAQDAAFNAAVSAFRDRLQEGKASPLEIRHQWEDLESKGRPLPELLGRQVEEFLAEKQRMRRRIKTCIVYGVFAIVLVGMAIGTWEYLTFRKEQWRMQQRSHCKELFEQKRYDELKEFMSQLEKDDAVLYMDAELMTMRKSIHEFEEKRKAHEAAYTAARDALEAIRAKNFQLKQEDIQRALENAERAAESDEEKAFVNTWKAQWAADRQRRQADADRVLDGKVGVVRGQLNAVQRKANAELVQEQRQVAAVRNEFNAIDRGLPAQCSPKSRDAYNRLQVDIAAREADVQKRLAVYQQSVKKQEEEQRALNTRLATLRGVIPQSVGNIGTYKGLLGEFCLKAPGAPETSDYKRVLASFATFENALSITGVSVRSAIPSKNAQTEIENAFKQNNGKLGGSIWRNDFQTAMQICQSNEELRKVVGSMLVSPKEKLYMLRYREKGKTDASWRALYSEKPFQQQSKNGGVVEYWSNELLWAYDSMTNVEKVRSTVVKGSLTTEKYDILYIDNKDKDANQASYLTFNRKTVGEAKEAGNVVIYLVETLRKLNENKEGVDPVQGFVMAKQIFNMMAKNMPLVLPEFVELSKKASDIKTDVPWQRDDHPETIKTLREIREFWAKCPSMDMFIQRLNWISRLYGEVLNCGMRCVGSVQLVNGKKVFVEQLKDYDELWILLPSASAPFTIVSPTDPQLLQQPAGTPVFAPLRGRGARNTRAAFNKLHDALRKSILVPKCLAQ